ncbi:MAG: insulinase family protein [Proteobacteria bacterium]|nr:insulinase family protein [Pseudomonadota bacterium]
MAVARAPHRSSLSTGSLPAIPPGTTVTTLDNGLTVVLREDRCAPVVSVQAWAQTGSVHEGRWLGAGLSHVLEHMLFKGTATRPPGKIDQEVQDAGGYMNAYTSFDRTVYHIDAPNTGTRVAVDVLCDIMQNATLPEDELIKELDVIRREMDMGHDDPGRRAGRRLFETAYTRSPYRFTIIGYRDIFDTLKREDIVSYYRERYAPNNVFFVVVGDFVAAEVLAQIKNAWAKTPSRAIPPMVLPEEPTQAAARETIEEAPIELGHFHFSWHIPDVRHADIPALDVLATLLGSGRSSRLFQSVREKQALAHSADAWTYNPGLPGLFGMSGVVDADKFTAARDAMLAEVEKMKAKPVAKTELSKAVKQFTSGTLATRKTMAGQAQDLGGNWLAASDLNFSQRFLDSVRRLTPADLQRVARQYLTAENRTLYALLPEGTAPKSTASVEVTSRSAIQLFQLPNGLRLLVKEEHRLPFVYFRAGLRGGVLAEQAANCGASSMLAKVMMKGTKTRTAEQLATEIESIGGSLDTYSGNNSIGVTAEVLRDDFALGLELVGDVLLRPAFPKAELEREREIQLGNLRHQRDELLSSCFKLMRRTLFGDAGYGLNSLGTEETVKRMQVADLAALHQQLVTPENCVLAIYGAVETKRVVAAVKKSFAKWKAAPKASSKLAIANSQFTPGRASDTRDKKQAVIAIGFPGTTMRHDDRYALDLIQEACSDMGSRLFTRIRERLGLAYYVGAQHLAGLVPGYFAFYCGTSPEKAGLVEKELLAEAELLRTEGLNEVELKRAKAKIIGQKKISRQDLGGQAMLHALDELYGLGYAHNEGDDARYEAVTLAQVREVASRYFLAQASAVAVISGPLTGASETP